MRKLKADSFARRRALSPSKQRTGVAAFVLVLVSLALLVLSRIEHPVVRLVQGQLAELAAPVLQVMAVPLRPVRRLAEQIAIYSSAANEVQRMRDENLILKGWEARARELERQLVDLGQLARVVEAPKLEFATGRVLADARGPFARSVLLSIGQEDGLKNGYPVLSSDGLIGRVLETGGRSSRILLLGDLNSRVPVLLGTGGTRAILIGDNSRRPRLAHISEGARLEPGLEVITSGVGGLYPRGLRIGVVKSGDEGWRVELHAGHDQLDYVSVLFFETPELDLAAEVPKPGPGELARRRAASRRAANVAPDAGP